MKIFELTTKQKQGTRRRHTNKPELHQGPPITCRVKSRNSDRIMRRERQKKEGKKRRKAQKARFNQASLLGSISPIPRQVDVSCHGPGYFFLGGVSEVFPPFVYTIAVSDNMRHGLANN